MTGRTEEINSWGNEALPFELDKGGNLWPCFRMQLTPLSLFSFPVVLPSILSPSFSSHPPPALANLMALLHKA